MAHSSALRGAVITLQGELGAGKTTFVRHLLRALGVQGHIKSPTYAVMEAYEARCEGEPLPVAHFDFYRFRDPQEWEDAGFRDVFAGAGLKLCEWPEQAQGLMPPADLRLNLRILGDDASDSAWPSGPSSPSRELQAQAYSPTGLALLRALGE